MYRSALAIDDTADRLHGFRIDALSPAAQPTPPRPRLTAVAAEGDMLPATAAIAVIGAGLARRDLPAVGDRLPIDGSWVWLGNISCWLSAALVVASILTLF